MSKTFAKVVSLFALLICPVAFADTEDAPIPWILPADEGHVFFAAYPPSQHDGKSDGGHGICYRLAPNGTLTELWRVSGWYTSKGYLSESGEYLVRFGPWAKDLKSHADLAVAFYRNGKLVNEYRVNELIKNPDALEYSASHYSWLAGRQTEPNGIQGTEFELTLIDKSVYYFDLKTGEITGTDVDERAVGRQVIYRELEAEDELRARQKLEDAARSKSLRSPRIGQPPNSP